MPTVFIPTLEVFIFIFNFVHSKSILLKLFIEPLPGVRTILEAGSKMMSKTLVLTLWVSVGDKHYLNHQPKKCQLPQVRGVWH